MIDTIVQQYGTESQRERLAAGRLPEGELRDLARAILFKPLDGFVRFRRLEYSDLKHQNSCTGSASGVASFKVEDDYKGPLTDAQWATWKMVNAAVDTLATPDLIRYMDVVSIKMRWHLAECVPCGAQRHRPSALISGRFCGMALSREYAL